MQATMVDGTSPGAPYDLLRPIRCRNEIGGRHCTGRSGDINWNQPQTKQFKCPKCGTLNLVHIVEAHA